MKKILFFLFILANINTYSQDHSFEPVFTDGQWYLNTGFSFGYYRYEFSGSSSIKILPTLASLEHAFSDQFGGGIFLGYAKWEYLGNFDLEFISLGGRFSWHFLENLKQAVDLDLDPNKWDFYASLIAGVEIRMVDEFQVGPEGNDKKFIWGPVLGLKYFFTPAFGVYAEGGRGAFGYGNAGIAFQL